jgi:hypothetical protein
MKRYRWLLTTLKACPLSHAALLVLSYRVYRFLKARERGKPAPRFSIRLYARALRMNRRTVRRAIEELGEVWCDDPLAVRPEWFPAPFDDGKPHYYRYYLLNPGADMTELENRVFWMTWSLTDQPNARTRKADLARLLRASPRHVGEAVKNLVSKELVAIGQKSREVMVRRDIEHHYWQDLRPKKTKPPDVVLSENWVACQVERLTVEEPEDRVRFVGMIEREIGKMKSIYPMREIQTYWETILQPEADMMQLLLFVAEHSDWVRKAEAVHREKGDHAETSIHMLTYIAKLKLKSA